MSNLRKCNSLVKHSAFSVIRNISTTCAINNKGPFDDIPPEFVKPYVEKEETTSVKRARLLYQSRKRGMLENGLLLSTFAKKYLDGFNENLLHQYDCLINIPSNDWDIFYWAAGVKPVPTEFNNEVMSLLKDHLKNDDRESRIVQPNLY